jgi:transcriptional regulator with XRE-family HTH domain
MKQIDFSARLRELRSAAGLTQKDLAESAGVALRTVSSLEQGLYEPVWSTVLALAEALGVGVEAFAAAGAASPGGPAPSRRGRPRKREE